MEEQVYLRDIRATVTQARLIVPGQVFAIAHVTSVETKRQAPERGWAIVLAVLGVMIAALAYYAELLVPQLAAVGLIFAVGGTVAAILARGKYQITVRMSSGEAWRTETKDREWVRQLGRALSQAIAAARAWS